MALYCRVMADRTDRDSNVTRNGQRRDGMHLVTRSPWMRVMAAARADDHY